MAIVPPSMTATKNSTIKIKKRTLEIPAALAAIPVNPNSAATKATTKKINDQRNIIFVFKVNIKSNYT